MGRLIISVGSCNPTKLMAVMSVVSTRADIFGNANVHACKVQSGVREQPLSLDETVDGAHNRAEAAISAVDDLGESLGADYSIGIESGLMRVQWTRTGYMEFCAVVLLGKHGMNGVGLSQAFECPADVVNLVLREGLDLNKAFVKTGRTSDEKIGNSDGAVGLVTRGAVKRVDQTIAALQMAIGGFFL